MTRAAAAKLSAHSPTRHQRYQDFVCLAAGGIRIGYPSPTLLREIPAPLRAGYRDRVVLILTGNRRYNLRGIHSGSSLEHARTVLKLRGPFRIGQNAWYETNSGSSRGIVKCRAGTVQEIGIAAWRPSSPERAGEFLSSFG